MVAEAAERAEAADEEQQQEEQAAVQAPVRQRAGQETSRWTTCSTTPITEARLTRRTSRGGWTTSLRTLREGMVLAGGFDVAGWAVCSTRIADASAARGVRCWLLTVERRGELSRETSSWDGAAVGGRMMRRGGRGRGWGLAEGYSWEVMVEKTCSRVREQVRRTI